MSIVDATHRTIMSEGEDLSGKERYGWVAAHGAMPHLRVVPKLSISIDMEYQREFDLKKARAIASEFSWYAFGAPSVARRRDGTLWAMDGQHRIGATKLRDDIVAVPVLVFDIDAINEEAVAFFRINCFRAAVGAVDKLRGREKWDPSAIKALEWIRATGRTPDKGASGSTIACVRAVERIISLNEPASIVVRETMCALANANSDNPSGKIWHEWLQSALFYIEERINPARSLRDKMLKDRILKAGYDVLLTAAKREAQVMARGSDRIWAAGMIDELDKWVRTKKLTREILSLPPVRPHTP